MRQVDETFISGSFEDAHSANDLEAERSGNLDGSSVVHRDGFDAELACKSDCRAFARVERIEAGNRDPRMHPQPARWRSRPFSNYSGCLGMT